MNAKTISKFFTYVGVLAVLAGVVLIGLVFFDLISVADKEESIRLCKHGIWITVIGLVWVSVAGFMYLIHRIVLLRAQKST